MTVSLLAAALMLASGAAALGYQIVWTQQAALWLGHEGAAVLAVVAAFFGGLSLGALVLGRRIEAAAHPARWYAACEAVIGLWSLALAFLMMPASEHLLVFIGERPSSAWHWTVTFAGTFLLLLPATAAMGATLPALARFLSIGALYAANTFGAVLGVLATAFWMVPALGLMRTAAVCAGLNLLCALLALKAFARNASPPPRDLSGNRFTLLLLAATGFLGIGYEVLVVRVLSQVTENTVYTFAMLLAVYLVGTAFGAAAYKRLPGAVHERLLLLLAVACLLGTASLWGAPAMKRFAFGHGMAAALAAEAALATAAFLLPTIVMGALFSHLATNARGLARALGVNTFGAALAPFVFGVLLLPAIGAKAALLVVAGGYLALGYRKSVVGWATAAIIAALAFWAPSLALVDVPPGGKLLQVLEGPMATVSVVQDARGVATLHINNRQPEGSNATRFADARQALLPLLLHPAPAHALFLGLGAGVSADIAAGDVDVDAVELLPDVIEASALFRQPRNPRLNLIAADARRFMRASERRYDVIVSDNFHPARSGSGSLYTVEHFQAVRERLAPGGVFCQWLPLHQLDLATLRTITRSFVAVYPQAWAMLATHSLDTPVVGLVALDGEGRFDPRLVRTRAQFGIEDELALLGSFIAGPSALARFAGDAPLNTDDRPVVAYTAPRITYAPDSLPRDRLMALLQELHIAPHELLARANSGFDARLAAYWTARDRFLDAGRDVEPTPDVRRMLAQVREPLLGVLRISPEFRPAYDPLVRMAAALASIDAPAARALLAELEDARRPASARPQ